MPFIVRWPGSVKPGTTSNQLIGQIDMLATFAEVAFIYQFSHVIRLLNVDDVAWVSALSWVMVVQVVVSRGFSGQVWPDLGGRTAATRHGRQLPHLAREVPRGGMLST